MSGFGYTPPGRDNPHQVSLSDAADGPQVRRRYAVVLSLLVCGLLILASVRTMFTATSPTVILLAGGAGALASMWPIVWIARGIRHVRGVWRFRRGRCFGCGYSMTNWAGGRCPECGTDPFGLE